MKNWNYALLVFIGGCCFGVLSTFVKLAYAKGFTLPEVSGSQFLFGALFLWLLMPFIKRQKLTIQQILTIILSGVPMGLTGAFYYHSLQTLDASLAIIFLFQFVWIGSLIEYIMERKRPNLLKVISILVLLLGSFFAAGTMTPTSFSLVGVLWGLLAAVSFSIFIYTSGAVGQNIPAIQKSAWLSIGGLLIVSVIFPPYYLVDGTLMHGLIPYGIFLGFFGVAFPPLLFSIGMPHIGSGLGTILSAAELPVAVVMSSIILTEVIYPLQWVGVVVILGGIAIGNLPMNYFLPKRKRVRSK